MIWNACSENSDVLEQDGVVDVPLTIRFGDHVQGCLPATVHIASPTIYARRGDTKDFPARSTRQQRGVVGGYVPVGWVVGWFGSGT